MWRLHGLHAWVFHWALWFPPTVQGHLCVESWMLCVPGDGLTICPGFVACFCPPISLYLPLSAMVGHKAGRKIFCEVYEIIKLNVINFPIGHYALCHKQDGPNEH